MSETEKKSKRRKERGLNVRVVQEQKEKKTDDVRVNTRDKKASSRKKSSKKAKKDAEVEIEIDTKKTAELEKKVEEKIEEEAPEEIEEEIAWKVEEKPEEKVEEKVEEKPEEKAEKEPEKTPDEAENNFETLNLHTDTSKATSKIIPRDVAKETPITDSLIAKEVQKPKYEDKPVATTSVVKEPEKKSTAKELKEQEIKKAVSVATKLPQPSKKTTRRSRVSKNFGMARVVLAIACLSTAVFAIVYFVNLNSSDISIKVAAMQSGIDAVYPSYIPRGYTLADVTSASGKVTMKYKSDNGSYTITEEQTDWNSDGLLGNFVKPNYGDEYTVVSEQGLTLYIGDRWAAWVNGGMVYKLAVDSGNLTKKQIKAIAVSL